MRYTLLDGYQKAHAWRSGLFKGHRYNVCRLCDGWVLQDTCPNEPGYVFTKGSRKLYAAKILGEAYSIEGAHKLIEIAADLERKIRDDLYEGENQKHRRSKAACENV